MFPADKASGVLDHSMHACLPLVLRAEKEHAGVMPRQVDAEFLHVLPGTAAVKQFVDRLSPGQFERARPAVMVGADHQQGSVGVKRFIELVVDVYTGPPGHSPDQPGRWIRRYLGL